MYTVVGYDKDNDIYVVLDDEYTLSIDAEIYAKELLPLLDKDQLRTKNGEPIDWIEIYYNYNCEDETMVWASYEN